METEQQNNILELTQDKIDPKKQILRTDLKQRVLSYFGEMNKEVDLAKIDFKINIQSVVEANYKSEYLMDKIIRDCGKNKDQEVIDLGITEEVAGVLRKSKLLNQFGAVCMAANNFTKAGSLFEQAIQMFEKFRTAIQTIEPKESQIQNFAVLKKASFSNAWYNQANQFASLKLYEKAIQAYVIAVQESPFQILNFMSCNDQKLSEEEVKILGQTNEKKFDKENQQINPYYTEITKCHFNSFDAFAHCYTNLSVMMMLNNEYDLANRCCMRSLEYQPNDKEAYINMNNIMRQMGQKEKAFEYVWKQVQKCVEAHSTEEKPVIFQKPREVDYSKETQELMPYEFGYTEILVVCVKYGTKYGADYVNKLYQGIKTNLSLPHKFACFTENPEGLDKNIEIIPLQNHWTAWWSKVNIFNGESYRPIFEKIVGEGQSELSEQKKLLVFYIDVDMIITGPIDDLILNFQGKFSTLTTNDIFCEQTQDGYNSSVMLFNIYQSKIASITSKLEEAKVQERESTYQLKALLESQVQVLYNTLHRFYDYIMKFMMRFDHYLEMLVWQADIVQELCPGLVLDYTQHCQKDDLEDGCGIVAFPRTPKPHEILGKYQWVDQYWVYNE